MMEGWNDSVLLSEIGIFGTYPVFSVNNPKRTDSTNFRFFCFPKPRFIGTVNRTQKKETEKAII
jgi:hypothetical protein